MRKSILFISLFVILLFNLSIPLSAQESSQEGCKDFKEYVMRVRGEAEVDIEPDSFKLVLVVESESASLKSAIKDNSEKISKITEAIKKLNIPNLEFATSNFNFDQDKAFLIGKKTKIQNKVTVKAESLGYDKLSGYASDTVDIAMANGATEVKNLSFYLKDESKAQDTVLKLALDDAKRKASLIAKELGLSLKPYNVLGFWFDGRAAPMTSYSRQKNFLMKESMAVSKTQVVAGKEAFSAQIDLEYKFE
ncbi:MAG: SIMPL domain-containing protein [Candidatus Omnitrophica bacterium]|nr:SIMPL domain-containing protein [Candidatus Omnitrophota bacterium]